MWLLCTDVVFFRPFLFAGPLSVVWKRKERPSSHSHPHPHPHTTLAHKEHNSFPHHSRLHVAPSSWHTAQLIKSSWTGQVSVNKINNEQHNTTQQSRELVQSEWQVGLIPSCQSASCCLCELVPCSRSFDESHFCPFFWRGKFKIQRPPSTLPVAGQGLSLALCPFTKYNPANLRGRQSEQVENKKDHPLEVHPNAHTHMYTMLVRCTR